MRIRLATPDDVDAIAAVHVSSWKEHYRGLLPPAMIAARDFEQRRRIWTEALRKPDRTTLVACDDTSDVIGFSSALKLQPPERFATYLQTLYLAPGYTGQGIGEQLLRATAAELLAHGMKSMALRTLRLSRARSFYERLGARPVPEGIAMDAGAFDDVVYAFDNLQALLY